MQTPTLAEPEAAAAVEEAAVEAAVEEAAVEAEEPPQAVRTPVAPTTAEAFRKSRREIIFIILFSFINAYHSISQSALVTRFAVSVCIITVWKIIRNGTSSQDSGHFFVHSSQLILLCTTFFLLSSTKSVENATYIQIPCQKSINPFKTVTTSFCSCNKFLCTENARFFPGVLHKTYISGKNRAFFSFFTFLCVRGGSGWG